MNAARKLQRSPRLPRRRARTKLHFEAVAHSPGNRLEKLSGDRAGQYSIRINDQWRICFTWKDDGPHDAEIVDHH
jgi:toxin HigB-1